MLTEIENEPVSLGRIDLGDLKANPDLIRDKLDEKIHALLDKYGYGFQIISFAWRADGLLNAEVGIVKKPDEVTTGQ
jgi:hypothetical protein